MISIDLFIHTHFESAINTLSVADRSLKQIHKLRLSPEIHRTHEIHHTPVLEQIVLEWIASHYYATSSEERERKEEMKVTLTIAMVVRGGRDNHLNK